MLNNIPKLISPELLKILCEMGHGDTIVIGDGNFPACSVAAANGAKLVRADGLGAVDLLDAILALIPLDTYTKENFVLMATVPGDSEPDIWKDYGYVLAAHGEKTPPVYVERFDFYERAKKAYAVIATGETQIYANIILQKGVIK